MTLTKVVIYTFIAAIAITGAAYAYRKPQNLFIAFIKNFLGAFLIFSGAVKAIDPLGTAYKMHDYFIAFGGFFPKLDPLTLPLAIFMVVLEIVLGIALIIGSYRKLTVITTGLLILFFTFLTGYTYLNGFVNPKYFDKEYVAEMQAQNQEVPMIVEFDENNMKVTDCGCFGDFLKIEPRLSFYKDIFLMVLIIILLMSLSKITPLFAGSKAGLIILLVSTAITFIFCLSNYVTDLPMVDFRPYKKGNNIPQLMVPEREAEQEFTFIYENSNSGEVKSFDMKNLPKKEDGWVFKDREVNIIDPGIPAKISNFLVLNEEGEEVNADLLEDENYNFWIVAYSLEKTKKSVFENKLNDLATKAQSDGYQVYAIASDANDDFRHDVQAAYPFYTADATFLKTIVRSNPGLVLVKNGVIIDKWHHKHIPTYEELKSEYLK
ncbi:MAG: DoxX family protein [Chitinophagales bacterium]|nr:DoxX family protein [Chitinophagales bacterium]